MEAERFESSSFFHNLEILDTIGDSSVLDIVQSWSAFCDLTDALVKRRVELSAGSELAPLVISLCKHGLQSLVQDHFLLVLEEMFENGAQKFWQHFEAYSTTPTIKWKKLPELHLGLSKALEELSAEKRYEEKCLLLIVHAMQSYIGGIQNGRQVVEERGYLSSKYLLMISSVLPTNLPSHFQEILHHYFKEALEELSTIVAVESEDENGLRQKIDMEVDESRLHCRTNAMDIDGHINPNKFSENNILKSIGEIVRDLRGLGLTSMAEDAYGSAIFLLLKDKVHSLAGDDYRTSVLGPVKEWIQAVPLQFFYALLSYLGDPVSHGSSSFGMNSPLATFPSSCYPGINCPSEELIRWQLRLEYFAYETLQDLRIAKLFEIIVDYPDSSPAIEDLKHCLEYTGQHSKLVDSFISALRYRLLTAGASTNDILHQYVSTVKALRTIDPAGVFLEAVGEPIKEYLRGRKDTIKCIVTMLTNSPCGNPDGHGDGDSLLEELIRDDENRESVELDDVINVDDKQAWINAQRWEPDPVEADPLRGSKAPRKVNLLGMIVGIIGSKDQLINEYRVMLAEKLLNKTDYDIDAEIRTLELLKIHFGEGSMQKCEIMLNDLIGSKRMNSNIKQTIRRPLSDLSMDILDATIISSNFWPPIQEESLVLPGPVDRLLSDYAKRFNEIKTPRKLLWKKNLGTVKLELLFEDRTAQFTVAPMHAAIITLFQNQKSWTSKNLAAAIGVSEDIVNRRISFWVTKGVLSERFAENSEDHVFTVVDDMVDSSKSEGLVDDDDAVERPVASGKNQLLLEMSVYEKFIIGMLTNFGSMMLEQIHNSLKIFCVGDAAYDKSTEQLQSFLSGLVSDEKLDVRDGQYFLKK